MGTNPQISGPVHFKLMLFEVSCSGYSCGSIVVVIASRPGQSLTSWWQVPALVTDDDLPSDLCKPLVGRGILQRFPPHPQGSLQPAVPHSLSPGHRDSHCQWALRQRMGAA